LSNLKEMYLTGSSEKERESDDFYRTPTFATEKLLELEKFEGIIWEPACGDGAISEVLISNGYKNVLSSDIANRGYGETGLDFLDEKDPFVEHLAKRANTIITNPPYKFAQEFIEKSLRIVDKKVAMLLKLNFLEGQKRYQFFKSTPLKSVYVFSKRLSFDKGDEKGKGNGLLAYAWYVWDKEYIGKPYIDWIL
jgi:hypothetical protein